MDLDIFWLWGLWYRYVINYGLIKLLLFTILSLILFFSAGSNYIKVYFLLFIFLLPGLSVCFGYLGVRRWWEGKRDRTKLSIFCDAFVFTHWCMLLYTLEIKDVEKDALWSQKGLTSCRNSQSRQTCTTNNRWQESSACISPKQIPVGTAAVANGSAAESCFQHNL